MKKREVGKPYFDPVWLGQKDPICREIARLIFAQMGMQVVDNPDKFGVDQFICRDEDTYGVLELEYVSRKSGRFDHDSYYSPKLDGVTIPGRKAKFLWNMLGWWMNFSSDLTHYIIIPGDVVLANEPIFNNAWNNDIDEAFYRVPKEHPSTRVWTIPPDISSWAINKYR